MSEFFTVTWWVLVCVTFDVRSKETDFSDLEDEGSVDYGNASMYTTSEMRDKVLAEWKGRTNEIQGYFDQLPSEEFKENSEDLKFQHYWEQKGVKGIDTNQVYNLTPQYYEPAGPMFTVEVNDSYVPKYRITSSEEERMEKYGTFHSESESAKASSEEVTKKKKKKKKDSSESGGGKKKKEKKTWPSNMDPKEKRKKKKSKTTDDEKKRKDLVEKTLNDGNHKKVKTRIQEENMQPKNQNQHNINQEKLQTKNQGNNINRKYDTRILLGRKESYTIKDRNSLQKDSYTIPNSKSIEAKRKRQSKLNFKSIDNSKIKNRLNKIKRPQKRSRQSINGNPLRPYL